MENPYLRWQQKKVKSALKKRRVLLLTGARQCGKTTLSQSLSDSTTLYRTLDNVTLRESAIADPHGFVAHGNNLMIIDEVQRAPDLLQAIKQDVDQNQSYGRFLITGSAHLNSLPTVQESLAGRIRSLRLRPLSMGELSRKTPLNLQHFFDADFSFYQKSSFDKNDYIQQAIQGGYPEVCHLNDQRDARQWHRDYVRSLIERDLKDIINIRRADSMKKLLEVLAAWSSKFMDISKIGASLSIQRPTVESYINALEALYLVERVRPWNKTDYDRVGKQDKLFMSDTGLMSSLLRWRFEDICLKGDLNGKLLETFIFNQLISLIEAQEDDYYLYHYRDREKREIDFLIENESSCLVGIEIKAGSAISSDSFKHLKWFSTAMCQNKNFKGIVLYTGQEVLPFGKNLFAVPMSFLWS